MLCDNDLEPVLLRRLTLERDQRAGVTRSDHTGRDRRLDSGASGAEARRLRHRDPMLAKPLRDLLVREAELLDQASQAPRLLDRIEVRPLEVFDEAEDQLLVVARLAAHDRGHLPQTCKARGTPTPLAGDELESVCELAHQDGLEHAVQPDRFAALPQRLSLKPGPDWVAGWPDLLAAA